MASIKWFSAVLALCLFAPCAFTVRGETPPSAGRTDDEQAIGRRNEECLKAYDIEDVATLDRREDADFTLSGDFGVVTKPRLLDKVRQPTGKRDAITRRIDAQLLRQRRAGNRSRPASQGEWNIRVPVQRSAGSSGRFRKLVHLHYSCVEDK